MGNTYHKMVFVDIFDSSTRKFDFFGENDAELKQEDLPFSRFLKICFRIPDHEWFLHNKITKYT